MTNPDIEKYPIDAVILWVDGNDEKHIQKMQPFVKNKESMKSKGFRTRFDQVNEIQFTVHSLLKYASFIRNIYIITDDQIPPFLAKKDTQQRYKKVSIIDHKVIFSEHESYLPTFNCRAIETCLHRIPNLAEHFVYYNDDFFLINKTTPSDFFKDGLPILRGRWRKLDENNIYKKFRKIKFGHKTSQQNAAKLIGFNKYYNFRHTPHPLRKSTLEKYYSDNPNIFLDNIKHKFRYKGQFTPQGLANHIEIKNGTSSLQKNLRLLYLRSYNKPIYWYKLKFNRKNSDKLFLCMQSLDLCPPVLLKYLLSWLKKRVN